MQFMTIFTFKPDKRDAVVQRRAEKGFMTPPGLKVLGEWASLGGGRVFRLAECDDPMTFYGGAHAWSDLGSLEVYPVVETDKLMQFIASK